MRKTSVRYFEGTPVRALWDQRKAAWLYAASDLVAAFWKSKNPRQHWNVMKKRHPELLPFVTPARLRGADGKHYLTDTLDEAGLRQLLFGLHAGKREGVEKWLQGRNDPLDEKSKERAYELFASPLVNDFEVGTSQGLQQIHSYLFGGLYSFAGKIRTMTISKGGFTFANGDYLPATLKGIDEMPDTDFDEIVTKYVEMNIAHPFLEGNGRATRIWLDLLLKKRLGVVVDWARIDKKAYLTAMEASPFQAQPIHDLLQNALTKDIASRETFIKGIDYSYYYEEED
jgi:cell filamentation protein